MKLAGACYQAYPEFPILPFDPAVFGFSDVSNVEHARQCPCFASGEYHLWWNWPYVAAREWCVPMDLFFITTGDPFDLDAPVVFQTESYTELVRHLLATPYAAPRPILEAPASNTLAMEFFDAMVSGAVLEDNGKLNPVVSLVDRPAAAAASRYLDAIDAQIGSTAARALMRKAKMNEARREERWVSTSRQPA